MQSCWRRLSILSQLLQSVEALSGRLITYTFQFFPSCCKELKGGISRIISPQSETFQFFPSCCQLADALAEVERSEELSILSQLLHAKRAQALRPLVLITFNSFPVAAEVLASWLLINLSTANFEVHENSPALPPDTCVGSRKPFPDSRRKEGIWTERNDV